MQPKTDRPIGLFSVLLIAIVSGLVIKVVGDPVVEVTTPKIEKFLDRTQDFFEDQDVLKRFRKLLKEHS